MTEPANLLAIDTSSSMLRLAVMFGGDRLVKSEDRIDKSHGQLILKHIDHLMTSSGIVRKDLNGVVVCLGPGSFTGLRIGLAVAKGIVTALDINLAGVSLFEMAEYRLRSQPDEIVLLLPYRKGELIAATAVGGRIATDQIETIVIDKLPEKITGHRVSLVGLSADDLGDAAGTAKEIEIFEYDAADLIAIGRERLIESGGDDLDSLEPCYLKKSQAEIRFDEQRRNQ